MGNITKLRINGTNYDVVGGSGNSETIQPEELIAMLNEVMPIGEGTELDAHTHNWTDATCTTPKTCYGCGSTEGKALGHTWLPATYDRPKTCSVCGATEGDKLTPNTDPTPTPDPEPDTPSNPDTPTDKQGKLSGVWEWDNSKIATIDLGGVSTLDCQINFTDEKGNGFVKMKVSDSEQTISYYKADDSIVMAYGYGLSPYYEKHTIDFGATEQTVDMTFWNWFTTNATKIS